MITIVNRYLIKRLLLASIIAVFAIYLPVLLIQLLAQLPGAALTSELLWPALFGLAPTIFYITLPVTVAIAITWTYRELSADGTLTTLYNAGLSLLNVRMPAFFLATTAVVVGFITSNILAPQGSTHVEDVLHLIKNDLSPSLLTPQQFHILNDGKRVIQYQERINRNWISGIFIKETNEDEELIFFARDAIFERRENETWIILRDGHMQSRKIGQSDYDTVSFTQITRPTGLAGMKIPKREWTGYFELETSKFLAEYANAQKAPRKESEWISEALERFGIPILALGHTLLGLALVTLWPGTDRNSRISAAFVCGLILLIHFLIVLTCEFASSQPLYVALIAVVAMIVEWVTAIILFALALRPPRARFLHTTTGSQLPT